MGADVHYSTRLIQLSIYPAKVQSKRLHHETGIIVSLNQYVVSISECEALPWLSGYKDDYRRTLSIMECSLGQFCDSSE